MPLPTTGLTFHIDASVSTDLWQAIGPFSDHPTDGEAVNVADDVEHADICAYNATVPPVWRSGTPLMALPCLDFNGSTQFYRLKNDAISTDKQLSSIIVNNAFTILASVYVEGITTNDASPEQNDCLISDFNGADIGIGFKNSADPHVLFYNYDGNYDVISLPISLNTSYVLMFRHESGNIYASLDGGSETSAASGDTSMGTGVIILGSNWEPTKFFNGRLGEMAIWNAALAGSDLTEAISYFTDKWLPAEAPSVTPVIRGTIRSNLIWR